VEKMKKLLLVGLALFLVAGIGGLAFAHGPGYGYGGGYPSCWAYNNPGAYNNPQGTGEKITKDSAKTILENRLAYWGNPNLKVGKITEKGNYIEGEIVTKDNSLVQKIQIDKNTGFARSVY
jgi:hypothetical protein